MLLSITDRLVRTTHMDGEMSIFADGHYSRRTPGARQFAYSGRKLVLRNTQGSVLFVWMFPDPEKVERMDGQTGFYCSLFRNESSRRASDIILEAETWAFEKWGPNRMFTYVDSRKIRSVKVHGKPCPGFCFIKAGWKHAGFSKNGKHLFVKEIAKLTSSFPALWRF